MFFMRFTGTDSDIDLATEHPEFSAWKWVPIEALPGLIVSFNLNPAVDGCQDRRICSNAMA